MPTSPSSSSSSSSSSYSSTLIPGLPNDIASQILCRIPYSHIPRLKPTSKSWLKFLSSKTLTSLRYSNLTTSHLLCIFAQDPSISTPFLFDPITLAWRSLPLMPCNPYVYGLSNFVSVSSNSSLFVLGGSHFDTRSYPIDRPCSSSAVYKFDFDSFIWKNTSPMLSPRGSFACSVVNDNSSDRIVVAGGGSRHRLFGAAGSRMSSVEMYDVEKDEWIGLDGLPRFRAGCVGFVVKERQFWVMGGYGESRTIGGVLPVDEYYKDVVVMELDNGGGRWREVGNMWEDRERVRLGKVVVIEDEFVRGVPGVFMLDGSEISRYDMGLNRWLKESAVPREVHRDSSFGFVALYGELYILTLLDGVDLSEKRRSRQKKRAGTLFIQIYSPVKKTWRSLISKPPFKYHIDLKTAVMCTVRL